MCSRPARYRLPETLREFGQERLQESGERPALRRRHRDWHEELARRVEADWLSPQMTEWAARLLREHANVQAAQDFCQAEPGESEAGLRIALRVWPFYYWNAGWVSEGRYRLDQTLARAPEPTAGRAHGLLLAGLLWTHQQSARDSAMQYQPAQLQGGRIVPGRAVSQ